MSNEVESLYKADTKTNKQTNKQAKQDKTSCAESQGSWIENSDQLQINEKQIRVFTIEQNLRSQGKNITKHWNFTSLENQQKWGKGGENYFQGFMTKSVSMFTKHISSCGLKTWNQLQAGKLIEITHITTKGLRKSAWIDLENGQKTIRTFPASTLFQHLLFGALNLPLPFPLNE